MRWGDEESKVEEHSLHKIEKHQISNTRVIMCPFFSISLLFTERNQGIDFIQKVTRPKMDISSTYCSNMMLTKALISTNFVTSDHISQQYHEQVDRSVNWLLLEGPFYLPLVSSNDFK